MSKGNYNGCYILYHRQIRLKKYIWNRNKLNVETEFTKKYEKMGWENLYTFETGLNKIYKGNYYKTTSGLKQPMHHLKNELVCDPVGKKTVLMLSTATVKWFI